MPNPLGLTVIAAAIAAGALLPGCTSSRTPEAESSQYASLATTEEMLVASVRTREGSVGVPTTEPPVSLRFVPAAEGASMGRIEGYTGVNRFVGEYTLSEDGEIRIGALASTKRAGPPALMKFESVFLGALARSTMLEKSGEEWVFREADTVALVVNAVE